VISAWRREGDIFVAETGNREKRVGSGKDVTIVQGKRGTYVAWTKDGALQILTPDSAEPGVLAPEGSFVSLLALDDGSVLAAWEARQSIETKRVN
jgi:hypothetical protein